MKKLCLMVFILIITINSKSQTQDCEKLNCHNQKYNSWNEETVRHFINQMKPHETSFDKSVNNRLVRIITNAALQANTKVPTNVFDFTYLIYELPISNSRDTYLIFDLISYTTNEAFADIFIWGYTNYYSEAELLIRKVTKENTKIITDRFGNICEKYIAPDLQSKIEKNSKIRLLKRKSSVSLRGLCKIGTPNVINRLNKLHSKLLAEGNSLGHIPGETIDPDKYPKESREWFLNHPELEVRKNMFYRWYNSSRPEANEVMDLYIRQLEKIPKLDSYWTKGEREIDKPHMKEILLREKKEILGRRKREYKRWLEDGKRMPLKYGCYKDGSWEKYKNRTEKERIRRYGKTYKAKRTDNNNKTN